MKMMNQAFPLSEVEEQGFPICSPIRVGGVGYGTLMLKVCGQMGKTLRDFFAGARSELTVESSGGVKNLSNHCMTPSDVVQYGYG